jgi:NAD(P)-dependent dehydrogenase (short-subunit alcohol dehydrogenase family)
MKKIELSHGMVFVTGGGGSIGAAIAMEVAAAGGKVAVADFNLSAAKKVSDEINANGGTSQAYEIDVTSKKSVEDALQKSVSDLGSMIGLVTAAAVLRTGTLASQSEAGWREIMSVNVDGTFLAVQAAVPYLIETKGSVVTLASVAAFIGSPEGTAYTTTKGAVLSFTYAAAGDLAPQGIRVNAVSPGWVDGGFTHQAMEQSENPQELVEAAKNLHYLGRMAEPSDVANAVVWLLSDQAAFVTGASLLVDGGYMIKH